VIDRSRERTAMASRLAALRHNDVDAARSSSIASSTVVAVPARGRPRAFTF